MFNPLDKYLPKQEVADNPLDKFLPKVNPLDKFLPSMVNAGKEMLKPFAGQLPFQKEQTDLITPGGQEGVYGEGERYPKAFLRSLEKAGPGLENPAQAIAEEFNPAKLFAPESNDNRTSDQIAFDIYRKTFPKASQNTAWEFTKMFPFTTLGTVSSWFGNPAKFLTFQGINGLTKVGFKALPESVKAGLTKDLTPGVTDKLGHLKLNLAKKLGIKVNTDLVPKEFTMEEAKATSGAERAKLARGNPQFKELLLQSQRGSALIPNKGDMVQFNNEVGKVLEVNPTFALLDIAGKQVKAPIKEITKQVEPTPSEVAKQPAPKAVKGKIETVNPTGSVFKDYSPELRAKMELGKNITTLDKTMEKSPDETITIYRGAPKTQAEIVSGDFITTNKQLAKDYAGTGIVLEKKVKLSDILDDETEPLGEEYIYRPQPSPLIEQAKKAKSVEEWIGKQTKLFRGLEVEELGGFEGRGVFLTPDKKMADIFAGKKGKVVELFIDKTKLNIKKSVAGIEEQVAKELDEFTDDLIERPQDFSGQINKLRQQGVDAVESFDGRQLLVFDKSKVQTKQQLTDIFNKAHKPEVKPVEKPIAEVEPVKVEKIVESIRKLVSKEPGVSVAKRSIHESTGFTKLEDTIITNEKELLKVKLQGEQKGSKEGYVAGKQDEKIKSTLKLDALKKAIFDSKPGQDRTNLKIKLRAEEKASGIGYKFGVKTTTNLARTRDKVRIIVEQIKRLGKKNLPSEYSDMVQSQLASLGLAEAPKANYKLKEFVNRMKAEGEFIPLSDREIEMADSTSLNNITLELLQQKLDIIKQIVFLGQNERKLIAGKFARDIDRTSKFIKNSIEKNFKLPPEVDDGGRRIIIRGKKEGLSPISRAKNIVDGFFSGLRKVEFISDTLDGFKYGGVNHFIIDPIQNAGSEELVLNADDLKDFQEKIKTFSNKELTDLMNKRVTIAKIPAEFTQEELIGVYVNSFNEGNMQRLSEGNGLEKFEVKLVREYISSHPKLKALAETILKTVETKWERLDEINKKLTGNTLGKVEGRYFPIKTIRDYDKRVQLNEAENDLFQEIYDISKIADGFTKSRVGGKIPVNLKSMSVFMNHIADVNHYITHALPVRDVQKLLHNDKVKDSIIRSMGEGVYNQFPEWLKDVANPRRNVSNNAFEKAIDRLRRNSTSAILGLKVSVSLLQGGSYSQTINEIGLRDAVAGMCDFLKNPNAAKEFIYEKDPQMKYRSKTFDRELRELLENKSVKELIKGEALKGQVLFSMIKAVDKFATLPTWLESYNKMMRITKGNEKKSIRYAGKITRETQPAGSVKDLAAIARGRAFQKIWVMFYTHFSNYHNEMVKSLDRIKYSDDGPLRKGVDAFVSWWWLIVAPSLFATYVRSGGSAKQQDYVKGGIAYGLSGIPIIRDIASKYAYGYSGDLASPALAIGKYASDLPLQLSKEDKNWERIAEDIIKVGGFATGLPSQQLWTTIDGSVDLMNGSSKDIRRLVYSKYQLHEKNKKEKKSTSRFGVPASSFGGSKTSQFSGYKSKFGK